MERTDLIALTKSLLKEYYEYGSQTSIVSRLAPDAAVFSIHSKEFVTGRTDIYDLLQKETASFPHARITKMKCREVSSEGGPVIQADLVFRRKDLVAVLHRAYFMYDVHEDGYAYIRGIHIQRDAQRELVYRMVSSSMLKSRSKDKDTSERVLSRFMDSYVDCAYVVYRSDGDLPLTYAGDELWQMLGYDSKEDFTQDGELPTMESLMTPHDIELVHQSRSQQLLTKDNYQVEYHLKGKGGNLLTVMEVGRHLIDDETGIGTFSGVITNIMPLQRTHNHFLYIMHHDSLTGLYNKATFCHHAETLLQQNPDVHFELMVVNINRFKAINDIFNEKTGDELLMHIASLFKAMTLPNCAFGRLHADNFVILYPAKKKMREHLITSLNITVDSFALDYHVDLSFGVYPVTDRQISVNAMCDRALMALSKAKNDSTNPCGIYDDDMRQDLVNEQMLISGMDKAIEDENFVIYLQPKYDFMTERIVGAEALVRWLHPKLGYISPGKFIPAFERNGSILKLDKYVWEKACQLLRSELDAGRPAVPISVNVSRVDLNSPNMVQYFLELVHKYELPPALLELELTESAYVDNPQYIINITKELQKAGFPILMDDFGSGYSSLNMLKNLPVDILKIDLKFLADAEQADVDTRSNDILISIVRMAKWLRIPVIVEGVETKTQVDFLRTIGCEMAQGYYFSKPVPIDVYESMLHDNYRTGLPSLHLDPKHNGQNLGTNEQVTLLNSLGVCIALYELVGERMEVLRVNENYLNLFGNKAEELYQPEFTIRKILSKEDWQTLRDTMDEAEQTRTVKRCTIQRECKDGRKLYVHVRITLIMLDRNRKVFGFSITNVDAGHRENIRLRRMAEKLYELDPALAERMESETI